MLFASLCARTQMGQSPRPAAGRRRGRPSAGAGLRSFGSASPPLIRSRSRCAWALLALLAPIGRAHAQAPEASREARLTFNGEAFASVASDDPGFFNYANYERSTLSIARLNLDVSLRLGPRAAFLAEARGDNGDGISISALYLRVRVLEKTPLDLQVGRIPPVFGAFGRRTYGADNPLIGVPLGYQYLTIIRPDALPASADDLLLARGGGWLVSYPLGSQADSHGLPLVAGDRWDTGIQMHLGGPKASLALALTQGTLSNPLVRDDNGGKQLVGRAETRPSAAWIIGFSAARGEFLSRSAKAALPPGTRGGPFTQSALGIDAEYSRGYWVLRAEGIMSEWRLPMIAGPFVAGPLRAYAGCLEGRYKIRPGLYAAARVDRLGFSSITGTLFGGQPTSWDAPVTRVEVGGGYFLRRDILLKAVYQHNWRDTTFSPSLGIVSAQALWWF
jgi:hypothetical protein